MVANLVTAKMQGQLDMAIFDDPKIELIEEVV
jgi:hypothetical protein